MLWNSVSNLMGDFMKWLRERKIKKMIENVKNR